MELLNYLGRRCEALIDLKYGTIDDAIAELGQPSVIRETFVGFQRYLYE